MTALAIGGGGYQANREYRAGHTGAAFYYATLSLLAAGLINLVPYLAKEAGPLGAAETPTATTNTPQGRIGLWRGVPPTSPGYSNALNGIADPIGGTATPAEHINGNTNSSFTSWTSDPSVAARFAGENGVVMFKVFNSSDLIDSTQVPETNMDQWEPESEYLVTGRVSGATVVKR